MLTVSGMSAARIVGVFVLWWWCCTFVRAETPVLTIYNNDQYRLADYLDFFEDPQRQYTFEDIRSPAIQDRFKRLENKLFTYGITRSNLWFRVKLRYPAGAPNHEPQKRWLYEVARTLLNEADLYIVRSDGSVTMQSSDIRTSFADRPINHAFSVFPVDLKLGEEVTLYLRIWNYTSTFVPQSLWSESGLATKTSFENFLYGIFYGGMIIICIYNFLLFLSSRDVGYLYYVGYLFFILLFAMIDMGQGLPLFDKENEGFDKTYVFTSLWLSLIMGCVFIYRFLELKLRHPVLNYCMLGVIAVMLIAFSVSHHYDPVSSVEFVATFTSTTGVVILVAAGYVWYAGNPHAPYFVSAWCLNILGVFIYSLVVRGLVPAHPVLLAALPVGIWLEAIILSQALANRIKQSEKAVLDANQRAIDNLTLYRSVFDHAMEGLYQMSLSGRLLSVNTAFADLLGYDTPANALADRRQTVALLYHSPEQQLRELNESELTQSESDFVNRLGQQVHVLHSARLVRDEQGKPLHIEGTLIDIGERKKREQEQRERLRERREKEVARHITDAKSNFLKSMSYEIRTPLSAIIGFSETIRHSLLNPEEKRQGIESIMRNSHDLLQLINDILDYSKMEAGKMVVESIAFELLPLVEEMRAQHVPKALAKGLTFEVEYAFPLPAVLISDPTRIRQILQNLCCNAVKYTDSGHVKLHVRWDNGNQKLMLAVSDTGAGMTKERVRRLLQPLNQARSSQIREGMGLGIAITRQLAVLLGGGLGIESEPGKGSRFEAAVACQLPEPFEWVTGRAPEKPGAGKVLQAMPRLSGRVLLAEDNVVNQKLIERVISKTGAHVTVVPNGQEALDRALAETFDLILMDVNMPVLGGLEATRALRRAGYSRPIYALTAEQGQQEVDASLAAGCNGHLLKPLEMGPFYHVLAHCLPSDA